MEDNYRYVASKTRKPLAFSVVNAGNIREFVMELSANAAMMWDFTSYQTVTFLKKFCAQYYGSENATEAAKLYAAYYNAYWQQRKPDLAGFTRQFIFQDLRYKRAIQEIGNAFNKAYTLNPLTDIPAEQLKGRTYRIIPADNGATNQIDAVIKGTTHSAAKFLAVAQSADAMYEKIDENGKLLFNDNLRQPAYYMYYLNESLLAIGKAHKEENTVVKQEMLQKSLTALHHAEEALLKTQHNTFSSWYAGDRIFGFQHVYILFDSIEKNKETDK